MLLAAKLKQAIEATAHNTSCTPKCILKNIIVNGSKRGCSGFVCNTKTGGVVFVSTEHSCYGPLAGKSMCRYAKDTTDYSSNGLSNGHNQWCFNDELAENIIAMLCKDIGHTKI